MPFNLAGAIAAELGEGSDTRLDQGSVDGTGQDGFCDLAAALSAEVIATKASQKSDAPARPKPTNGKHERDAAPESAESEAKPPPPRDEVKGPEGTPPSDTAGAAAATGDASRTSRFESFAHSGGAGALGVTVPQQEVQELPFSIGEEVEVFGLQSQFGEYLNGQIGVISKWVERKGRFMVRFGAGESDVNLRPENLRKPGLEPDEVSEDATPAPAPARAQAAEPPASGGSANCSGSVSASPAVDGTNKHSGQERAPNSSAQESEARAPAAASGGGRPEVPPGGPAAMPGTSVPDEGKPAAEREGEAFLEGEAVLLRGLSSADGQKLNGQRGRVMRFVLEKARFEVRLDSGDVLNVKPGNLQRPDEGAGEAEKAQGAAPATAAEEAPPDAASKEEAHTPEAALQLGDTVEVFGLESEGGRRLNGKRGVLKNYDEAKARFQVDIESGALSSLKPSNLRKVDPLQGGPAAQSAGAAMADTGFSLGDVAQVCGLSSEAGAKLNGQRGFVVLYDDSTGRLELRCQSGNAVRVKPINLQLVRSPASASALHTESSDATAPQADSVESHQPPFGCADVVIVRGLQSESGKALNGQMGIVSKSAQDDGRIEILFASGNPMKIKPENLQRLDMRPAECAAEHQAPSQDAATGTVDAQADDEPIRCGDHVEVFGLESEKGKAMNGQTGIVKAYSSEKQRYEVGLSSGASANLKLANIRRLGPGAGGPAEQETDPEDDQPSDDLLNLSDEERLASVQQQLLEAIDTPSVQAQVGELRAGAKNMRQYGRELESLLRPIRDPVYRRHGVNRDWHLRTVEELGPGSEECQAQEERLQELCAFIPAERSEQEQAVDNSAGGGA
mmetsp:Transcript_41608/g.120487  ORF Transcript_41608/g.120487 Transcript_41608/m.120487 type:complete len:849 (-) Transcript_41608:304-2850(-)